MLPKVYKPTIWELFTLGTNATKNSVLASIGILGRGNTLRNCFWAMKLVSVLEEKRWHGGTICELLQICEKKWRESNKGWLSTLGLVTGMSPPLLLPIPSGVGGGPLLDPWNIHSCNSVCRYWRRIGWSLKEKPIRAEQEKRTHIHTLTSLSSSLLVKKVKELPAQGTEQVGERQREDLKRQMENG